MQNQAFLFHYILLGLSGIILAALGIFFLSLYIRLNFIKTTVICWVFLLIFFSLPAVRGAMAIWFESLYPFTPGVQMFLAGSVLTLFFIYIYSLERFGVGARIPRRAREKNIILMFHQKDLTDEFFKIMNQRDIPFLLLFDLHSTGCKEEIKNNRNIVPALITSCIYPFSQKTENTISQEIKEGVATIKRACGRGPKFLFPGSAIYNASLVHAAAENKLKPILFSTLIKSIPKGDESMKKLIDSIKGGQMVLFSIDEKQRDVFIKNLPALLDGIEGNGIRIAHPLAKGFMV